MADPAPALAATKGTVPPRLLEGGEIGAYIGLGANLGDPAATLRAAVADCAALPQTRLLAASSLYRSAPVDAGGGDYVNAVIHVATRLGAPELLLALLAIEAGHGRQRAHVNAPRTLDLDLLLYGDAVIEGPGLIVPHPRMHQRAFVLQPLAELDPMLRLPAHGALAPLLEATRTQRIERLED